ncbi:SCO family protein [Fulvivirgaceae bacterium BMA10]|uniref:SCO family protein n=1 Tax=Splendidivirga corallicola TaxID=3051826 RepID=A0ABT8KVE7_9BACT|nr:SCO family protein [Fulvivirgaceae bacterium BMA10]
MNNARKNIPGILLLFLVFIGSCNHQEVSTLPFYNTPDLTPVWIKQDASEYDQIHTIADFNFVDQNGNQVTEENFKDKIYVADFFFTTCPGICTKLTNNMTMLQEEFKSDDDILLLSHSVTPEMDSMSQLKEYAQTKGVLDNKWFLVTGDRDHIYDMARNAYFADDEFGFQKNENSFLHTENFILIDKQRRIRGIYNGTLPFDVKRLIEDIRILKEEG